MKNVLTVDDSKTMLKVVSQLIEVSGHKAITATNGLEGLEKLKTNKIDLILTDINMPIMGGEVFIVEVRKIDKVVPIIVVTTESEALKVDKVKALGASGWAVKPLKIKNMLELFRNILD